MLHAPTAPERATDAVGCLSLYIGRGSALPNRQLSELLKLPPDARAELAMALS